MAKETIIDFGDEFLVGRYIGKEFKPRHYNASFKTRRGALNSIKKRKKK